VVQLETQLLQVPPTSSAVMLSNADSPAHEQGSTRSNEAATPHSQRPMMMHTNASSPERTNDPSTSGLTAVTESEGAAEGLTVSRRTNDPVIGSTGANFPTRNSRLFPRTNSTIPILRNASSVLNETGKNFHSLLMSNCSVEFRFNMI